MTASDIRAMVREYYGTTLAGSDDLRTNACTCAMTAPPKYVRDIFPNIDPEIITHFYGCGSPLPPALEGATVLDLGCGTGRDVFIAAKLVGPQGKVIGVDMTRSQLEFARAHEAAQIERLGLPESNVTFIESFIEDMATIPDESVDVVISNCVINLSPFKQQLFAEVFRVLKPGGELYFSDIFSDRRVPEGFYDDPILRGECLAGAMYAEDFRRILRGLGCPVCYDVTHAPLEVGDFQIATKLGSIGFASRTMRAIKCDAFEDTEEDYRQTATYLGTMPENKRYFDLNEDVRFIVGRPLAISGNMATFLEKSRYGRHFEVTPRRAHVGPFDFERANAALPVLLGKRPAGLEWMVDSCERMGIKSFAQRIHDTSLLETATLATMQVNVGYRCNLACTHCYLSCSPKRDETMSRETMEAVLDAFVAGGYRTLDITGGSPEMNPNLEWFIERACAIAEQVIVRSNLCILNEPPYAHFKDVYVRNKVKLVASLPYFDAAGTDGQRGMGSFARIIEALRMMNGLGYGTDPDLQIDIAYNVDGPFLPPDQADLEDFYRFELERSQNVKFNGLYAMSNWNVGRFAAKLLANRSYDAYHKLLADNYNGAIVAHMMCRSQVNVDFDGGLHDCEVNHVLGLPIQGPSGSPMNVRDIVDVPLGTRTVRTHPACYTCAAGCGSSCGGSLLEKYATS